MGDIERIKDKVVALSEKEVEELLKVACELLNLTSPQTLQADPE